MYFTQDDYKKIEQWLQRRGIKDSQFEATASINDNDIITLVQDNINKKIPAKTFIEVLNKTDLSGLVNISEDYNLNNTTLEQAINIIPVSRRKKGQIITFDKEGQWGIFQFKGNSIEEWTNLNSWINIIDRAVFDYSQALNKPKINNIVLEGNNTLDELGIQPKGNYPTTETTDNLQNQINTLISRSDVVDIVESKAALDAYDKSSITENDVIKVLKDESKENAITYYRLVNNNWFYIGSLGAYYTKSEVDGKFYNKQETDEAYEYIALVIKNETDPIGNKDYLPFQFSGLGRINLPKHIVDGKNVLTQEMLYQDNTIYVIQYDYELVGTTEENPLVVPENCILQYNGGSISNGFIKGLNLRTKNATKEDILKCTFIEGVNIVDNGINEQLDASMIGMKSDDEINETLNSNILSKVFSVKKGLIVNDTYYINQTYDINYPLYLSGNGKLFLKKTLFTISEGASFIINGLTFESNGAAWIFVKDKLDILIDKFHFEYCRVVNIRPTWIQYRDVPLSEKKTGINSLLIRNNYVNADSALFIFNNCVVWNECDVSYNIVENMSGTFFILATTNEYTHIHQNVLNDCPIYITNNKLSGKICEYNGYLCSAVIESPLVYFINNECSDFINISDGSSATAYDAYLSCGQVYFEGNICKNILLLPKGGKDPGAEILCEIGKSKGIYSKDNVELIRYYVNNTWNYDYDLCRKLIAESDFKVTYLDDVFYKIAKVTLFGYVVEGLNIDFNNNNVFIKGGTLYMRESAQFHKKWNILDNIVQSSHFKQYFIKYRESDLTKTESIIIKNNSFLKIGNEFKEASDFSMRLLASSVDQDFSTTIQVENNYTNLYFIFSRINGKNVNILNNRCLFTLDKLIDFSKYSESQEQYLQQNTSGVIELFATSKVRESNFYLQLNKHTELILNYHIYDNSSYFSLSDYSNIIYSDEFSGYKEYISQMVLKYQKNGIKYTESFILYLKGDDIIIRNYQGYSLNLKVSSIIGNKFYGISSSFFSGIDIKMQVLSNKKILFLFSSHSNFYPYSIDNDNFQIFVKLLDKTMFKNERPEYSTNMIGEHFYDKNLEKEIVFNGTKWITSDGNPADAKTTGVISDRPDASAVKNGFIFTDTSNIQPVVYMAVNGQWITIFPQGPMNPEIPDNPDGPNEPEKPVQPGGDTEIAQ